MCYLYAYTQFYGLDHLSNDREVTPPGGPPSGAADRASHHAPGAMDAKGVRGSARPRDLTVGTLCGSRWRGEGYAGCRSLLPRLRPSDHHNREG